MVETFQMWATFKKVMTDGSSNDKKTRFLVEINLFIVFVRVKCVPLHYTDFPSKQCFRHKFLRDDFSKSSQRYSTKSQKVRTKRQLKIWNRFAPNRPMISSVDCFRQRFLYQEYFYLRDPSFVLYNQFLNNDSRWKKLNNFERFKFVDTDNTFQKTNFTKLNGAISSYQSILPCALHSEVWSCAWMVNWSKSSSFHLRGIELWDSHDLPNVPPRYPLN